MMKKQDPGEGIAHGSNLELGDTGPSRPFTQEQETRIKELAREMVYQVLHDSFLMAAQSEEPVDSKAQEPPTQLPTQEPLSLPV